jgi:hypothetical protein
MLSFVRYAIFSGLLAIALAATFQSPARLLVGYPELQESSARLSQLDNKIAALNAQKVRIGKDRAANNATALADRPAEKRNNIEGALLAELALCESQLVPLQEEREKLAARMDAFTVVLTSVSQYIRMFGLGMLGAIGGLLGAYAANGSPQITGQVPFLRNMAGLVFGGFTGLIGYGLVYTGQVTIPHFDPKDNGEVAVFLMIVVCLIAGAFANFFYRTLASWLSVLFPSPSGGREMS